MITGPHPVRLARAVPLLAAALVAALALAGCSSGDGGAGARELAVVNGEAITTGQLDHRMKLLNLGFANVSAGAYGNDAAIEALSQLIDEAVCLQEAKRLGISATPQEVDEHMERLSSEYPEGVLDGALKRSGLTMSDFRAEASRKLSIEKLIEKEVYSGLDVDDKRLRAYFKDHRDEFNSPMRVRARQIVVDSEASARAVLARLKTGADFSELAAELSLSPDGEAGGDLGYFARGEMPREFDEVVFRMKPGELSGVVQTPYGYHIFLVDDIRKAENPGFEDVRDRVRQRLLSVTGEDAYAKWQAGLRDRASIEIHTEALGRL